MSGKLLFGLAIAVAVLAFGATTATAHRSSTNTEIVIEDLDFEADRFVQVTGHLNSPRQACKPARKVLLFAVDNAGTPDDPSDDDPTFVDADITSLRGAFLLEGTYPAGTDYFVVHVTRENRAPSGHRHICRADTDRVNFPD